MMPRDEALRESMELYRRRAKACRVAAEGVSGECLRVALLEVAKSYDLLAEWCRDPMIALGSRDPVDGSRARGEQG